jgi:hypothetical protein
VLSPSALSEVCSQCPVWLFSVCPWYRALQLQSFMNEFQMISFAAVINGITHIFTFHILCIITIIIIIIISL